MKQEVKNHLLGDTAVFAFMLTTLFAIVTVFNIDVDSYYILANLIAVLSVVLGEKLVGKFYPHLMRGFKDKNEEVFLVIVIITFIGKFISGDISFWLNLLACYLVFIVVYGLFEQMDY